MSFRSRRYAAAEQRQMVAAGPDNNGTVQITAVPEPTANLLLLCQVKSESLLPEEAKKLPRAVSGVRLGRLAVAKQLHGGGHGKDLVIAAMSKFLEIFEIAGGIGLFVDAKDSNAKAFYEYFGFISLPSSDLELFLPVASIQQAFAHR